MSRTAQQTAKNKATKLHSELVRARGHCQNCGESVPSKLQAAHIVSRRYSRTRVRLDNAFCLCARCHMHFTEWPLEFHTFVVEKIGIDGYMELKSLAQSTDRIDWVEELAKLKQDRASSRSVPSGAGLVSELE